VIEPIRDHWLIVLGIVMLLTAVIVWWRSR
jgi:LPXTG-motif cell wall-anchored protein